MQINLRKAMFVLPNLFTVSSIFLGFYSMTLAAGDATPEQLYRAALAIFFAIFFDMFDGRVARMTRTQSEFGVQLDSLADVISFGAAPALLVYKWALAPLGFLGLFLSFCLRRLRGAAARPLQRAGRPRGQGAPTASSPACPSRSPPGALVSVVIAHYRHYLGPTEPSAQVPIAVLVALLSFLMVSTVRYRTFKDTHLSARSVATFLFVLAAAVVIGLATRASFVLLAFAGAYILMGLVESIFFRHTVEKSALPASVQREIESDEALEPDDDDLEAKDEGDEYL